MDKKEFYAELESWFKKATEAAERNLKEFEEKLTAYNDKEQAELKLWIEGKVAEYEELVHAGYKHLTSDQDYWTKERLDNHVKNIDLTLGGIYNKIVEKLKAFFKI
tara:strand:- start:392 stop:709 length:318 start_codon:yes stop_codon:yes gene_type:complete